MKNDQQKWSKQVNLVIYQKEMVSDHFCLVTVTKIFGHIDQDTENWSLGHFYMKNFAIIQKER
jgi:hypothetical protein